MEKHQIKLDKKHKILKASKKLFLQKGFTGASVSQIADEAGVAKSLVYHHFSSKEKLWQNVKNFMFEEHFIDPPKTIEYEKFENFKGYLRKILTLRFDLYSDNPEIPRMMNWERLQGSDASLYGDTPISPQTWIPALRYFLEHKMIREDIPPEQLIIFISSTISASSIDMLNVYCNKKEKEAYLDNLIDLIYKGLKPT